MRGEITYEWTPQLVRLAARRFIWRRAGLALIAGAVVMLAGIAALASGRHELFWWVLVVFAAVYLARWVRLYVLASRIPRHLMGARVSVRVDDDTITFEMADGFTTLKWAGVPVLWSFREILLVFTRDSPWYTVVPTETIDSDLRLFIERRVRESGGRVSGGGGRLEMGGSESMPR